MHIVLARHGKPKPHHWAWITPLQMKEWIAAYDQADILIEGVPSDTMEAAASSGIVVSSTLPRCVQSANYLGRGNPLVIEEMFCEAALPYLHWRFPKLPFSIWGIIFRLAWFYGFSSNAESFAQANERACIAAQRLVQLAKENDSVFLVGHGIMTMLIAKHLLTMGWVGSKRPVNKYWQLSIYYAAL
jgi:broad specificity phosphatase PhoE